jgi:hypothetical protein
MFVNLDWPPQSVYELEETGRDAVFVSYIVYDVLGVDLLRLDVKNVDRVASPGTQVVQNRQIFAEIYRTTVESCECRRSV